MPNPRETNELRQYGALLVISNLKQDRVLAISDYPKIEVSAGTQMQWWDRPSTETVIGFPGGGRGINTHGLPETLGQVLRSEAKEEVHPRISIPKNSKGFIAQHQEYPFVVGQQKLEPKDKAAIKQFAVTSLHLPINQFSRSSQALIEGAVDQGSAFWIPFTWILDIIDSDNQEQELFYGKKIRPQFLTTALLWHLQLKNKFNQFRLKHSNAATIQFIQEQSALLELPIHNGTFLDNGAVKKDLSARDNLFLGIIRNNK